MDFILADNQALTRMGLKALIASVSPCSKVYSAGCKRELVSLLESSDRSVTAVLDYTLFNLRSFEELLILIRRFPGVLWVLMSASLGHDFLKRAISEDRVGAVLKDAPADELEKVVMSALRDERYVGTQIKAIVNEKPNRENVLEVLTATETEILKLIARGLSTKEIAVSRNSSIHTIMTHKKHIFAKLDVNTVYEATRCALRAGLVDMVEYYI